MIDYFNINSPRDKLSSLPDITQKFPTNILRVDETKPEESFLDPRFKIDGYQYLPFKRKKTGRVAGKKNKFMMGLLLEGSLRQRPKQWKLYN